MENLKLGKEDVLRIVVQRKKIDRFKMSDHFSRNMIFSAPLKGQHAMAQNGQSHPPELEHRVKKSGSKYEITFKPTEVGTHKVGSKKRGVDPFSSRKTIFQIFAYVNEIQHPQSPFNIRIYDASEMIVGEIPKQSYLNDTVEFTGKLTKGLLEIFLKVLLF